MILPNDLVLVRHGESMGNVWPGAYKDDRANFLSIKGIKQAEIAGIDLVRRGFKFTHVITSNLTRAIQTATVIMQTMDDWKRKYEIVPGLNEKQHYPTLEDQLAFTQRVMTAFDENVLPALQDGPVLCVSHYFTTEALLNYVRRSESRTALRYGINNAVPHILPKAGGLRIIGIDDYEPQH